MSDDNISGPYRRDRAGFRTPPEDRDRPPHWYELVVFVLFRYFWFWGLLLVLGLWLILRR